MRRAVQRPGRVEERSRPAGRDGRRACPRPGRLAALALVASLLAASAACSDDGDDGDDAGAAGDSPLAPTEEELDEIAEEAASVATIPVPEGFVVPDSRAVALPVLEPADDAAPTEPSVPIDGGEASLIVEVAGPDNAPVPGAIVLVERFADGGVGTTNATAGDSGRATLNGIHGGRYRVRAWAPPDLTATESQVAFLSADERAVLRVHMEAHGDYLVQGTLQTGAWTVGQSAVFEVLVLEQTVSEDGIVRGAPVVADVELSLSSGLAIAASGATAADDGDDDDGDDEDEDGDDEDGDDEDEDDDDARDTSGSNAARTSGDGRVSFVLTCESSGNHRVNIRAVEEEVSVDLPPCTAASRAPTTGPTTTPEDDD